MSTFSAITGQDASHNAGKAAGQAQQQMDLQRQQQEWQRQLFDQWIAPYMQAGLAQLPGQTQNYNTLMGYIQNMMSGNNAGLPAYLQPADTSGLEKGLSTLSRQGLDQATQGMQGNIAQYYAQRGVPISQQQTNLIPRFQNQFNNALATENANKATTMYGVNQASKANQLGNFFNMLGAVNGMVINPSQYAGVGINMAGNNINQAGNNANYYNQLAQQYAQQSGGMMGNLGSIIGSLWGDASSTNGVNILGAGNTGLKGNNYLYGG
ncbi:MAG: hypothetical protein WC455_11975 [Dehalococcoidia bacterium]|jgi:hypothetical protein